MGSVQLDRQALQLQAFHLAHQEGLILSVQVQIQLAQALTVDSMDLCSRTAVALKHDVHSISTRSAEGPPVETGSNTIMLALPARTSY
jgi:hypothetical protein